MNLFAAVEATCLSFFLKLHPDRKKGRAAARVMVPASFDQRAHAVLCFVELAQRPLLADHLVWDFCGRADTLPRELTIDQLNHAHRKA
eukprot:COSAG02_NODE_10543_length_1917_cov_5.481151_3_plen_87_part_01